MCSVVYLDYVRGDKLMDVTKMVSRAVSVETLLAEIEKCEAVCANCHRVRTQARSMYTQ